ncbi:IS3 family transposase [Flavobacterium sp. FlaQc-48]|uniref:IS3 family transposase n=1 Tax=Flavobacterium sp. FlaQc-48 TaxID=3374181 RepID=UPI00375810C4
MEGNVRYYDPIFKENAVLLSHKRETVLETAKELDITPKMLSKWRCIYKTFRKGSFPGRGHKRMYHINSKIFELENKLTESQLRLEILKKGSQYIHQGKQELYNFIYKNRKKYLISKMCEVLGASTSTYYSWTQQPFTKRETRVHLLKKEIVSVFFEFKQHHGSILITRELHRRGYQISDTQVSFWMKQLGLRSKVKKRFKVTTDSKHNLYTSPNVLNRQFKVDRPSKVWVSDITYIQIDKRFLYLTVIIDLYDRKIVGWNLSSGLSTVTTIIPAWNMAVSNRKILDGLLFHSDRGVQYANKVFTNILDGYKCTRSMSRKANSIDNAVSESFFNSLKRELIYSQKTLLTPKEMRAEIFEYIENWYNKKRRHSALKYKTIEEFNAEI